MLKTLKYPPSAHPLCVAAQAQLLKLQLITCNPFTLLAILVNSTTQCSLHLETFSSQNSPNAVFAVMAGVSFFLSSPQTLPLQPSHLGFNWTRSDQCPATPLIQSSELILLLQLSFLTRHLQVKHHDHLCRSLLLLGALQPFLPLIPASFRDSSSAWHIQTFTQNSALGDDLLLFWNLNCNCNTCTGLFKARWHEALTQ